MNIDLILNCLNFIKIIYIVTDHNPPSYKSSGSSKSKTKQLLSPRSKSSTSSPYCSIFSNESHLSLDSLYSGWFGDCLVNFEKFSANIIQVGWSIWKNAISLSLCPLVSSKKSNMVVNIIWAYSALGKLNIPVCSAGRINFSASSWTTIFILKKG